MKAHFVGILVFIFCNACKKDQEDELITFPPPTGTTVKICNQTWMVRNLDVATYRNGDPIPEVKDDYEWMNLTTGAWCWYNNDSATYGATYGRLYNWFAVNDPRGLAPEGWHIPSDEEWTVLADCLGGNTAGGKLKEAGTDHWLDPNVNATNESGFTALPGDARYYYEVWPDTSTYMGGSGYWWTSTENPTSHAFTRELHHSGGYLYKEITGYRKEHAFSVRCVKD